MKDRDDEQDERGRVNPGCIDPKLFSEAIEEYFQKITPLEFLRDFWARKPDIAREIGLSTPEEFEKRNSL